MITALTIGAIFIGIAGYIYYKRYQLVQQGRASDDLWDQVIDELFLPEDQETRDIDRVTNDPDRDEKDTIESLYRLAKHYAYLDCLSHIEEQINRVLTRPSMYATTADVLEGILFNNMEMWETLAKDFYDDLEGARQLWFIWRDVCHDSGFSESGQTLATNIEKNDETPEERVIRGMRHVFELLRGYYIHEDD